MVEMGIDRIHHAFWRYCDKSHRLYVPGNKYENVIHDYYIYVDQQIGKLLEVVDKDTGGTPSPRKLRVASARMVFAMPRQAWTTIG